MADHYLKALEHLDDDALKRAEVHALLAIAQRLEEISSSIDAGRPIPYLLP